MRQRLIGLLFLFPGVLILLALFGGPYFSRATGAYLIGGIVLVAFGMFAVGAGFYYLFKSVANLNE